MAKLTSKYLSGASKLEKQNFNIDSFNSKGATYMDVDKALTYMKEAKNILSNIEKSYERIAASYKKALGKACTASGKKMDTKSGPGKSIKKYYKAADRRVQAVKDRKKTLTSQMERIEYAQEMQNNTYGQKIEQNANNLNKVNANEN